MGNSLAARLPKEVVDILQIKEGDDIEITVMSNSKFGIGREPLPREIPARLRKYRGYMPTGMSATDFFDSNGITVPGCR